MTCTIIGILAAAALMGVLVFAEIARRNMAHDLAVSVIAIEMRDAQIVEQQRLLRAVTAFERKEPKP